MNRQTKLYDRWITFVRIIVDPWIIILSISLVILIVTVKHSESLTLHPFIIILVALLSGLMGAVFIRRWMDLNDEKFTIIRGEQAIKNLKLIYFNLQRTERRIKVHIKKLNDRNMDPEINRYHFEEIIEKCNMIEEECINAISLWSDLIEESNARSILLNMFNLKEEEETLKKKIFQLKKDFMENPSESRMGEDEFLKQMDQKEFELKELTTQIVKEEEKINHSILSGMAGTAFYKEANSSFTNFESQEN